MKTSRKYVARMDNDFNQVSTRELSAVEEKILMAAISQVNDKHDDLIEIPYKEFCKIANISPKNKKIAEEIILQTGFKINLISTKAQMGKWKGFAVLFPTFMMHEDTLDVRIRLNADAIDIFNDFKKRNQYTEINLADYTKFESSYTLAIFRRLQQFKSTGWWYVDLTEFRQIMGVPMSYTMDKISQKILKKVEEELFEHYGYFEIEKIPVKSTGKRGRRPIQALKFHFPREADKDDQNPYWKTSEYLELSTQDKRKAEKKYRSRKHERGKYFNLLVLANATEPEKELAMKYYDAGDHDGYDMILNKARQSKHQAKRNDETPVEDVPYSYKSLDDNLPF